MGELEYVGKRKRSYLTLTKWILAQSET